MPDRNRRSLPLLVHVRVLPGPRLWRFLPGGGWKDQLPPHHEFLDGYIKQFKSLDLLVLNANPVPGKLKITDEGHDQTFGVGYLSRYMFSVKLNKNKVPLFRMLGFAVAKSLNA